jgi:hypothetical protein
MGLDATVYCDCFEKGRLKSNPPPGCVLTVNDDGSLLCGSDDLQTQLAFDQWCLSEACEHEFGTLIHRRLGNIALIELIQNEVGKQAVRFPEIQKRVLYNGTHSGDFIPIEILPAIEQEAEQLAYVTSSNSDTEYFLREFESSMRALV